MFYISYISVGYSIDFWRRQRLHCYSTKKRKRVKMKLMNKSQSSRKRLIEKSTQLKNQSKHFQISWTLYLYNCELIVHIMQQVWLPSEGGPPTSVLITLEWPFCSCWPWPWFENLDLYELDLDILKMYLHTENKVSRSKLSNITAWTGYTRHTDTADIRDRT